MEEKALFTKLQEEGRIYCGKDVLKEINDMYSNCFQNEWLDKMNELCKPVFEEMKKADGGDHSLTGLISWVNGELIFSTCRAVSEEAIEEADVTHFKYP